jgi:hypothetical protein
MIPCTSIMMITVHISDIPTTHRSIRNERSVVGDKHTLDIDDHTRLLYLIDRSQRKIIP